MDGFDFSKFIDESKATLVAPKDYFSKMAKQGGLAEPVIKALVYGLISGVIYFVFTLLNLSAFGMFGKSATMALIGTPIFAIIGLFIGGIIMLIISAICGGNTAFEANVRVVAALMVLGPVQALFSFLSGISFYLGIVVSALITLYGLYLTFIALVNALNAKENVAKIVVAVLAILYVVSLYGTFKAYKSVGQLSDEMMQQTEKLSSEQQKALEQLQQLQKSLEKLEQQKEE
ncbi:MAG: YIP1 family protein [Spirochaetes bacterium]|nr:YIP1 family protein [Spirochaetota bacterium]